MESEGLEKPEEEDLKPKIQNLVVKLTDLKETLEVWIVIKNFELQLIT